jgi:hypothetical protein
VSRRIDFRRINRAALAVLPNLLERWLPGGRIEGAEYVAINPKRVDHHLGSFRINLSTGAWADFAIAAARGSDVIALAAYLAGTGQAEAALEIARMLRLPS